MIKNSANQRIGVLIAQLGTPDAPTAKALRPYLKQFLSDRRVIDYNPFYWQTILRLFVLPRRPKRSARLYARIWLPEGSPLTIYSNHVVEGLQERLGEQYRVILGMTYGEPSIANAMKTLESEGIHRIVVVPMFPQYSSTTTAPIYDAVFRAAAGLNLQILHEHKRFIPTLRFVDAYYKDERYLNALEVHLNEQLALLDHKPDQFVITFHGIPHRYTLTGDPYRTQCEETAQLLADRMGWKEDDWTLCFQSRFGPEEWLQPYTEDVLTELASKGVERPFVFSPGFVTDCLETMDELGNEGRMQFEEGGGDPEKFRFIPCLNEHPMWMDTLETLVRENSGGWDVSAESVRSEVPQTSAEKMTWQLAGD